MLVLVLVLLLILVPALLPVQSLVLRPSKYMFLCQMLGEGNEAVCLHRKYFVQSQYLVKLGKLLISEKFALLYLWLSSFILEKLKGCFA